MTETKQYVYGMMSRPPMYGTCPPGFTIGESHEFFRHGTIVYDHPLSVEDVYRYELALLSPLPSLPLYPAGSIVKDLRRGQNAEIELLDGEYFVGNLKLLCDDDWRSVRMWMMFEMVTAFVQPLPTFPVTVDVQAEAAADNPDTVELNVEYYVGKIHFTWELDSRTVFMPSNIVTELETHDYLIAHYENEVMAKSEEDIAFFGVYSWTHVETVEEFAAATQETIAVFDAGITEDDFDTICALFDDDETEADDDAARPD